MHALHGQAHTLLAPGLPALCARPRWSTPLILFIYTHELMGLWLVPRQPVTRPIPQRRRRQWERYSSAVASMMLTDGAGPCMGTAGKRGHLHTACLHCCAVVALFCTYQAWQALHKTMYATLAMTAAGATSAHTTGSVAPALSCARLIATQSLWALHSEQYGRNSHTWCFSHTVLMPVAPPQQVPTARSIEAKLVISL